MILNRIKPRPMRNPCNNCDKMDTCKNCLFGVALEELALYHAKGKPEELEEVVRCVNCINKDDVSCPASYKRKDGYYTPRTIVGCLAGERNER